MLVGGAGGHWPPKREKGEIKLPTQKTKPGVLTKQQRTAVANRLSLITAQAATGLRSGPSWVGFPHQETRTVWQRALGLNGSETFLKVKIVMCI